MPKLIVFAGLPGTGKTTLARLLAVRIRGVLLNKDDIRAKLFAPADIEYSDRQNDFCMDVIYQLARYHLTHRPERPVILDGRTFSRQSQLLALNKALDSFAQSLLIIRCVCSLETASKRIQIDQSIHPAADRTVAKLHQIANSLDTMAIPHLVLDTDQISPNDCLNRIVQLINHSI